MTGQRRKILLIVGGVIALLIFVASIFSVVDKIGKVELNVAVAPNDAILMVDGKTTQPGKIYVTKGKHELKASKDHFTDDTKTIETDKIDSKLTIYLIPKPDSTEAQKYLDENPSIQQEREHAGDLQATQTQEEISKKFPILTQLPHENPDYKIDYGLSDNNTKINFVVTLYPYALPGNAAVYQQQLKDFKQEALQWLKDNGIDTTKTTITFNPNPDQ